MKMETRLDYFDGGCKEFQHHEIVVVVVVAHTVVVVVVLLGYGGGENQCQRVEAIDATRSGGSQC